jgi:hypothetical protein
MKKNSNNKMMCHRIKINLQKKIKNNHFLKIKIIKINPIQLQLLHNQVQKVKD